MTLLLRHQFKKEKAFIKGDKMPRQIYLFSAIDKYAAQYVIGQLLQYDRESEDEITMFINSPGGSVNEMFAIIDAMDIVHSPIRTIVTGIAASAAAVIASCGDKRYITENSRIMIHEAWTIVGGSVTELDEQVEQATKEQEKLLKILAKNTRNDVQTIKNIIKKKDKYFSAKESVNFGLADEVIKSNSAQVLKLSEAIHGEEYEFKFSETELSEVQLLKTGSFSHPQYGTLQITSEVLSQMKVNFDNKVRGIDISLDYTHENDGGELPAAAWIKSLEVRDIDNGQALFAKAEFTPKGKKLVQEKEYKYASADFVIDYVTQSGSHVPYVLRGGTLTNRPFIKEMESIKLSELKTKEIGQMDKEAMYAALKERHGIDVQDMEASVQNLTSKVEELQNQIKTLGSLPAEKDEEINVLKNKLLEITNKMNQEEKERLFNELVAQGKVLPAQKEKVMAMFGSAEKIKDFYADAPAIVKTQPTGDDGHNEEGLTEAEETLVKNGILTKDEILANRSMKKK
jgi:ATP-dependent Clp protease protease subunit